MPKQKKNGRYFNIYMNAELLDRLAEYNAETGVPKTTAIEKALRIYLDKVAPRNQGTEAGGEKKC